MAPRRRRRRLRRAGAPDHALRVEARFGVALPEGHAWTRLRRVADLGVRACRCACPKTLRLDQLFVSEALVEPERVTLWLRRSPRTGAGVRVAVASETEDAEVQLLDDLGQPQGDVYELDGDERATPFRLASALVDATFDLALRRQLMTGAALDGTTLRGRFEPRDVCARLIAGYAPIVSEISRRSCAPNELMLRRDLGGGRREAVFITRNELRVAACSAFRRRCARSSIPSNCKLRSPASTCRVLSRRAIESMLMAIASP